MALIRSCLDGDSAAWEQLLSRYERLIFAIPRRAGLDTDEAADVFQEVCLALHSGLPRLKSTRGLTNWIITTTRRISRDFELRSRRQIRQSELSGDDEQPLDFPDPAPLTPEVLEELELQHQVRLQLTALDERCRRLLLALYYTEPAPSYSEIARALGLPTGSIGPTRARCFEKLRKDLEP